MKIQNNSELTQPRKLMLKRETLRVLTQEELRHVAGGMMPTHPKSTSVTSKTVTVCCW